jgi:superfamily I DNA/RNA helicase
MNLLIHPQDWKPVEVESLEEAAEEAVRTTFNTAVIAGPGAGKTELLAQRAGYLLQTGLCPKPHRILAISFKRDAAANLKLRVDRRYGPNLVQRFDSYTFDAFAKGLLDRFLLGLPDEWRPTPDYQIIDLKEANVERFLGALTPPAEIGTNLQVRGISPGRFIRGEFIDYPLAQEENPTTINAWAAKQLWQSLRRAKGRTYSYLSFPMISRLAEMILHTNPSVLRALRATYSHVFLDEFQDTTRVQYDLMKTAFQTSRTILSAVGDNKQRIMGWAGALPDAFGPFAADFRAKILRLTINYRSAPELVRIQQYLIRALDAESAPSTAHHVESGESGSCQVLTFPDNNLEAVYLAKMIKEFVTDGRLSPRDICIAVKMKPDIYARALIAELATRGVKARVESELQDLLTEPLVQVLLIFMRLASKDRGGADWANAVEVIQQTRGPGFPDDGLRYIERDISRFRLQLQKKLPTSAESNESLLRLLNDTIMFIGEGAFRLNYPQYQQDHFYNKIMKQSAEFLWRSYQSTGEWQAAIEDFEGVDSIPVMTIHKSKGLEYHTVIFLGLEDSAFWSFRSQSHEDKCAFFVAFSRAKRRVFFTFCRQRRARDQGRESIGELYKLLESAHVQTTDILAE